MSALKSINLNDCMSFQSKLSRRCSKYEVKKECSHNSNAISIFFSAHHEAGILKLIKKNHVVHCNHVAPTILILNAVADNKLNI